MTEFTTKKQKLVVPGSVIKEYNESKPGSQIFGTDFAGDQYYDYKLNTLTGNTEIYRDSPYKIFDRKLIGIIKNKSKNVILNDNATEFETFYFNKNNTKKEIVKINQQNLIKNGVSPKEVNEIIPSNVASDDDSSALQALVNRESVKKGTRSSYENLVYPTTLRRSNNDRLKISILEPVETDSERKGGKGKAIGSVTLPPPGKITDNNKVDFKSGTLNPLELALAEAGLGILINDDTTKLQENIDKFVSGGNDLKTIVSGLFVGKAINKSADAILSREAGAIINPNMQLLFSGPSLRTFGFNYKMSPRDRGESVQVQKIIRMFKQSSAVQRTETNFFLRSPNRYRLEFLTGSDSSHRFLPKVKTCALLGFGVDYTPENTYMTYENNSMVSYLVTFAFQEIEPIFNDEYSKFKDSDVGF